MDAGSRASSSSLASSARTRVRGRCSTGRRAQERAHAVDKGLTPQEPDVRVVPDLGDEMLATAKPDLKPGGRDRFREQGRRLQRAGVAQGDCKCREDLLNERFAVRPEAPSLPASVTPVPRRLSQEPLRSRQSGPFAPS